MYFEPLEPVQLTEAAGLTLKLVSKSILYAYTFDNISVVYSLVDAEHILALMSPEGKLTPALETYCDS